MAMKMMGKRLLSMTVMGILFMSLAPLINYPVSGASGFSLVSIAWGSIQNPQKVYPGSSNVILVMEMINNLPVTIKTLVGNLTLPGGFTDTYGRNYSLSTAIVESNSSIRKTIYPGESFRLNYVLNIAQDISPGSYQAFLRINYTYYNSTSGTVVSSTYDYGNITLVVSEFPSFTFSIERLEWLAGGQVVNASPGARGLSLRIYLRNLATEEASELLGVIRLSTPFYPNEASSYYGSAPAGALFTLVFNDISIDVSAGIGVYYGLLVMNFSYRGYGDAIKHYTYNLTVPLRIGENEYAGLEVVRTYWDGYEKVYPGARGVFLHAVLENMGRYSLSDLKIKVSLPNGFSNEFGLKIINTSVEGVYGYGDFIDIMIGPIYIDPVISDGIYYADLGIRGVATVDGASIIVKQSLLLPLIVSGYEADFDVVNVEWSYMGQPAFALSGSKDITLIVTVAYRGEEDIAGVSPTLLLPSGFIVKEVSGYPQTIPSSAVFSIAFTLDISEDVEPKYYSAVLNLGYVVSPNTLNLVKSVNLNFPVLVSNRALFDTQINIVEVSWGASGASEVYPLSKDNPLRIELANYGPYDAQGVILSIYLPEGFSVDANNVSASTMLAVGSFAIATFYVSVGDVEPGTYNFNFSIRYIIRLYGCELNKVFRYSSSIEVYNPPFPKPYLKVLSYQWENNYNVYPGTRGVQLVIELGNDAPYPISAIHIYPDLPEGFSLTEGEVLPYVGGPIPQWSPFTFSLGLDIDPSTEPGYHTIAFSIEYVLDTGEGGLKISESINITVVVDELGGIRYLFYRWIGYSPGPGSADALLVLVFRNDYFEAMNGLYAEVRLPDGFISTYSGASIVNVTPYIAASLNEVTSILSSYTDGLDSFVNLPVSGTVSKGDYIIIPLPMMISVDIPIGEYATYVTLNFIDEWDMVRELTLECRYKLPGSVDYVEVIEDKSKLVIGDRETNVSIVVRNPGSSPMYDVYIGVNSLSQVVMFSSTLKHIDVINPGEEIQLTWRATVSPTTSYIGGIPVLVSIAYFDSIGAPHMLNQTVILYVEGLARLKVIDVYVEPEPPAPNSIISVSATIVNVGSHTAKNTEVYLMGEHLITNSDSYTFLGDIDEGTQIPFTLYGFVGDYEGEATIYLIIKYDNVYNEESTIEYPISIRVEAKPAPVEAPTTPVGFIEDYWKVLVVGVVSIFLVLSVILIYKMYRASKTRLGMS